MTERIEFPRKSRVLIVGGAGFVGSNLVRRILEDDPERILVVDNLLSSERLNIPDDPRVDFIEGSIADDVMISRISDDFDYVFHLATFHGNQNSIHDPIADHDNNTLTSLKLFLHLSRFKNVKRVVYSSAGCTVAKKTFDDVAATTEDAPVSLFHDSPYQLSKIFGEFYGNYFHLHSGLPFVKARFQNVYGPWEVLGAGQWRGTIATVWRNVIPTFIFKALQGEALPVENGGIATRDFIFVSDLVEGLVRCAILGEPPGTYNLASGVETSILELAQLVNELTNNPAGIQGMPARVWDRSGKRFGSTSKSLTSLGFSTTTTLEEGLEKTINWTLKYRTMIDSCIAKHRDHLLKSSKV